MSFFERKIPDYLTKKKNTTRQILFTVVFALVFINLYSPFGVDKWYDVNKTQTFFYSSLVILTGLLIIAISRIILYQVARNKSMNNGSYIIWIAAEIISLSVVYLILQRVFISTEEELITDFKSSLKVTSLVLLLPYTISYLYFSWLENNSKLEELSVSRSNQAPVLPTMMPFHDEKGELRFSLKSDDLLYLEAADNYVYIHYLDQDKPAKYMIRNSLKNMEEVLRKWNVVRCHRSYIVNFERVKIVRREKDGLVLELDMPKRQYLPISRTYVDGVMKLFSRYTS
jgi:DNA-binding LytR/AlgR family response regulator